MMKRVLVTGGAGFIGSHTVDLLLKQGLEVVVIDNLQSGKLSYLNLFNPQLRFIQTDVKNDKVLREEIARCDAVLHLAALPSVPQSIENPVQSLQVNIEGFLHVLQAIRRNHRPIRLVYASSAAVYGDVATLPCSDDEPTSPALSPYALEKATNEHYAKLYERLFGIKSLGLRYFNVYGTRQDPKSPYSGVISKFIEQYQKSEPILIFGDGKQSRDFIHVADVAAANCLALQSDFAGILNIATGVSENLLNLVSYIEKAGARSAELSFQKPRKGDIQISYADVSKAEKYLKFKYTKNLANGIQELIV